jgi:hypothetical protein
MTTGTRRAVSMGTDGLASDALAAAARRTGLVTRTSQLPGQRWRALVPFGAWRAATTTLAPWAAQVTPWDAQGEGSPEAIHPRLHQRARAFRQDLLRQARAKVPAVDQVCHAGLLTDFPKGSLADRTGWALPDRRHALVPGSGGRAATAGAPIQAGWDSPNSVGGPCALPPWTMPDPRAVDTVGACAHQGVRFLWDCGSWTINACAGIAAAGASCFRRLKHQTTRGHTESG